MVTPPIELELRKLGLTEKGEVDGEFALYKVKPKSYEIMKSKGITLEEMFK